MKICSSEGPQDQMAAKHVAIAAPRGFFRSIRSNHAADHTFNLLLGSQLACLDGIGCDELRTAIRKKCFAVPPLAPGRVWFPMTNPADSTICLLCVHGHRTQVSKSAYYLKTCRLLQCFPELSFFTRSAEANEVLNGLSFGERHFSSCLYITSDSSIAWN